MKLIDLFAGCGGMTAGFVDAGFEPVLSVEWELAAAATYAANFGAAHVVCGDIAEVAQSDVPRADVLIGGPPCQGFSNLGTRDPQDPRNKLWREYVRVLEAAQPKMFIIENVDRFSKSPEFDLLMHEVSAGHLTEYDVTWGVLNAADFGAPQRRNRTIVVGSRVSRPTLPEPTHSKSGDDGRRRWATVRDAIADLPEHPVGTSLPDSRTTFFGNDVPGVFKGLDIHVGRNPRPSSLERYDCIPPGGGRFDLPDALTPNCWKNKPTGTTDVMGRMRWDAPSLTIRTEFFKPEKGQYLHPQYELSDPSRRVNRPITHLEAARLQTFSADFLWCGSKIDIARQIGNAVPPILARAIACAVREQL